MFVYGYLEIAGEPVTWRLLDFKASDVLGVRLTVIPADASLEIAENASVRCEMGRLAGSAGSAPIPFVKVARGRVVSTQWVWDGEGLERKAALEIEVDGSDGRFTNAPDHTVTYTDLFIKDLLRKVYVDRLGFSGVQDNLPEWRIPRAKFTTDESYHGAMLSLLGVFEPLIDFDPVHDTVLIRDMRRRVGGATPARSVTVQHFPSLSRVRASDGIVNVVRIALYGGEVGNARPVAFDEVEEPVPDEETPDGFQRGRTWIRRRRYYGDDDDPTKVTDTRVVGVRTLNYGTDGNPSHGVKTEHRFEEREETLDKGKTVRRYQVVQQVFGLPEFMEISTEDEDRQHRQDEETGVWELIREDAKCSGLVILPDLVPVDEAHRTQIIGEDGEQTIEDRDIWHSKTSYTDLAGGQILRVYEKHDDLHGGAFPPVAETLIGTNVPNRQSLTRTVTVTDQGLINTWGRKAARSFDGRPYGERIATEIAEEHIISHPRKEDSIPLAQFDPSFRRGLLLRVTDPAGATHLFVAASESHRIDCTNDDWHQWSAASVLGAVRLRTS